MRQQGQTIYSRIFTQLLAGLYHLSAQTITLVIKTSKYETLNYLPRSFNS